MGSHEAPCQHLLAWPHTLLPSCSAAFLHLQVSLERYIDIPQEILDVYKLWR